MSKSFLSLVLFLAITELSAQRPIPCMFVDSNTTKERMRIFDTARYTSSSKTKSEILHSVVSNKKHPLHYTYPVPAFMELLQTIQKINTANDGKGMRIIFGAYKTGTPCKPAVPMGQIKNNQLVLIFAASKGATDYNLEEYYIISPMTNKLKKLPLGCANQWIENYYKVVNSSTRMASTIDPRLPENRIQRNGAEVGVDTESLYYDTEDLIDYFIIERAYQDSIAFKNGKSLIDSIEINFAAHRSDGIGSNRRRTPERTYSSRMIIQFEFRREGKTVYLEGAPGYDDRTNAKCSIYPLTAESKRLADNGQLCPSQCPR